MKHLKSSAASSVACLAAVCAVGASVLVTGCGGSGGGNNNNGPVNNLGTPRIEAIVLVSTRNLQNPTQFTPAQLLDPTNQAVKADLINPTVFGFQDMTNFQTGENYVFQLVAYGSPSAGNPYGRVILPATFGSSDSTGAFGTLADNSGVYLAGNTATTNAITIYASYNGQSFNNLFDIKPRQARVLGAIDVQGSMTAQPNAVMDFYDVNGNLTGTVTSAVDGTFRASLPTSTAAMTLDPHSLPTTEYDLFGFGGLIFNAGDPGCRALVPTLTTGTQTLSTITTIPTTVTPEPSPTGCG